MIGCDRHCLQSNVIEVGDELLVSRLVMRRRCHRPDERYRADNVDLDVRKDRAFEGCKAAASAYLSVTILILASLMAMAMAMACKHS